MVAQRRPEPEPRRHLFLCCHKSTNSTFAQRRPEPEPRRHGATGSRGSASCTTLNEGRSLNPGDTTNPTSGPIPRANVTPLNKIAAIPGANANTIHTKSSPPTGCTTPDGTFRHGLPGISEGPQMGQSSQGSPITCSWPRPKQRLDSFMLPGKRYTITASCWLSMIS